MFDRSDYFCIFCWTINTSFDILEIRFYSNIFHKLYPYSRRPLDSSYSIGNKFCGISLHPFIMDPNKSKWLSRFTAFKFVSRKQNF
ncbi:hypothetical protein BpHYR1_009651 [Brachionus plicatilis]|uniref:Uncharacterized protein n=1 Tax=Brachionus plicatilis TaxID=10195 RepID=A0A3M7PCP8_BRAPC|nr:hypothetical protein BpHYR1_009651 [Brachionus plicatilis]